MHSDAMKNGSWIVALYSLLFVAALGLTFAPKTASAAANITIVSAQIATSSSNAVLVQLDNPNSTTLSSLTAASWHIDINGGGASATTSQTATIMQSSYPFTVRLTFQGPLAASYSAALGLYVDASGVTDSDSNTNTVVGHASSVAISAVDSTAPTLSAVTIASNNSSTTLAKSGDTVTLSFTADKAIFTPAATSSIGTHTATVSRTSPTVWTASAAMDATDTADSAVTFVVSGLRSIQGVWGTNVSAITSGSDVILDRTAPTITLTGSASDTATPSPSEGYSDPGASVSDSREGSLGTLVTTGSVNRNVAGTYTLTYNASDSAGNAASTVTRSVTVNSSGGGGIFAGTAADLPGYEAPRPQIRYPDGRVEYLDSETASAPTPSPATNAPIVAPPAVPSASAGPVGAPVFTRQLRGKSTGDDVIALQTFLEHKGFLRIPAGVTKGYFGPLTEWALKKFQESVGLEAVGVVGPKTRAILNSSSPADFQ